MDKKTELLAPVGGYDSVTAALNGGCDAIYIGGSRFGARAYAKNCTDDEMEDIFRICRLRGVKVFLTVNTLCKEDELPLAAEFVCSMYNKGADGFIIQDMGLFYLLKNNFPNIPLHASTQMTVHNYKAVEELGKLGFCRVVLSREMSQEEIKQIKQRGIFKGELEAFIHGALCVSYSGRCLMSSFIGGRSGNRGRCAQPCRMDYSLLKNGKEIKKGCLLSPKDIATENIVDDIVNSGVYSLKIEGRMKSPQYVYETTSFYRKVLDNKTITNEDRRELEQIFNRGGSSTTGYFNNFAGIDMISPYQKNSGTYVGKVIKSGKNSVTVKTVCELSPGDGIEIWNKGENTGCGISLHCLSGENIKLDIKGDTGAKVYRTFDKKLDDKLKKACKTLTRQMEVKGKVTLGIGKPVKFTLFTEDKSVTVEGDIVTEAINRPLSSSDIISRLSKTGNTPFKVTEIEAETEENAYIPLSSLNNLRREACEKLENAILDIQHNAIMEKYIPYIPEKCEKQYFTVLVTDKEQLSAALECNIKRIYVEISRDMTDIILESIPVVHKKDIEIYGALPRIYRSYMYEEYKDIIEKLENSPLDGYLIRSFGSIETNKKLVFDYSFNIFNSKSLEFFVKRGDVCLSPELNLKEINKLSGKNTEAVVYGRIVLMTTHQCPVGLYDSRKNGRHCSNFGKSRGYELKDRKNAIFPVMTHCDSCTAFILNNAPLYLPQDKKIYTEYKRLDFTTESKEETKNIITSLVEGKEPVFSSGTTKGHYFRGVL